MEFRKIIFSTCHLSLMLALCSVALHSQPTDISGIVNRYSSVTAVLTCPNIVRVENPERFSVGDTVLLIQMKGASVDTSKSPTFGVVTAMNRAGRFERNIVERIVGNDIHLRFKMLAPQGGGAGYEAGQGVQLIRIPSYGDARVVATLTAPAWDGKIGGVLAITVRSTVFLNADINVDGLGFAPDDGIARTELAGGSRIAGGLATAGRGGAWYDMSDHIKFGGGGGAQAGCGGVVTVPASSIPARGSAPVVYGAGANWIFMGGGGGSAGDTNAPRAKGGRGGGIIIIDAPSIVGNDVAVLSAEGVRGENAPGGQGVGAGGGGAGGVVLTTALSLIKIPLLKSSGGAGGASSAGPSSYGAGGGGGAILLGTATSSNQVQSSHVGGAGGGAATELRGCTGLVSYNNTINESKVLFFARTFSVSPDTTVCAGTAATLRAKVDGTVAWHDAASELCSSCDTLRVEYDPNSPDTSIAYFAELRYSDGCLDTAHVTVIVKARPIFTLVDPPPFCDSVIITGPTGYSRYVWSTGDSTQDIVVRTAQTFTLTVFDSLGCSASRDVSTRYRGDTVLSFEPEPPSGPYPIDSIFPGERACIGVPVRNRSDADLTILSARMARGVEISVPMSQFPITTSPAPVGSVSASIEVCAGAFVPGVYVDTLYMLSACGETMCTVSATILETKAYSRCHVRVTSDGEIEVLAADARPFVADVMGRELNVDIRAIGEGAYCVRGLSSGAYVLRVGNETQLLLR